MRHITRPLVQRARTWGGALLPGWNVSWPSPRGGGACVTICDTWDEAVDLANDLAQEMAP